MSPMLLLVFIFINFSFILLFYFISGEFAAFLLIFFFLFAVIPGTGDEPVTLTFGEDIGKAVCVLLDEPKWEKYTYINGDTTSWNKILQAGEQATGTYFNYLFICVIV